jgi:hypothetical protein
MSERAAGLTYFGDVLARVLGSRDSNQSKLARELRARGRSTRQSSVSEWMSGEHYCPGWFPVTLDEIYDLTEEEWYELGMAFAYGQRLSREDIEDVREFRRFYRQRIAEEREERAREDGRGR